jgi:hypothetical protein
VSFREWIVLGFREGFDAGVALVGGLAPERSAGIAVSSGRAPLNLRDSHEDDLRHSAGVATRRGLKHHAGTEQRDAGLRWER